MSAFPAEKRRRKGSEEPARQEDHRESRRTGDGRSAAAGEERGSEALMKGVTTRK